MSEIVVTEEMVEAARAAFHEVRLREASPHRTVREWETEAWRCAIEAAWNRRAPSVTREEIAKAIAPHLRLRKLDLSPGMIASCITQYGEIAGVNEAADAILALLRGGAE